MKAATIQELKAELQALKPAAIVELCIRLARYKKENKELLTYLLFEAHDATAYLQAVKAEVESLFADVNTSQVYLAKKTIRKILRLINKHCKYMGSKEAEAELILHYCQQLKQLPAHIMKAPVLQNLLQNQLKKAEKLIAGMHEDLQYEFQRQLQRFY